MQRFYAPDGWATSDLAVPAAKEALKRAGRKPEDVDLVIVGTTSPDYITPDKSAVLQHKLGAKNAGIFDVDCACASFPALVARRLRIDRNHSDEDDFCRRCRQ